MNMMSMGSVRPTDSAWSRMYASIGRRSSSVSTTGERVVRATSAGFGMGIQPCAFSATRRRVNLELPPIQMGTVSCAGRGKARTSRASKWRPLYVTDSPVHVWRMTSNDSSNKSLRSSKSTPMAKYSGFK
jgi:hypothetical protein